MSHQSPTERDEAVPRNQMARTDHPYPNVINLKSERPANSVPKVLLTDTNRWALSARLAMSLSEAGCEVSAVCPIPGHPLLKTRAVKRTFPYSGINPLKSLGAAIQAVDPDIIVPACDRSIRHLHDLYAEARRAGESGNKLAALIERSLGSPANHTIVASRHKILSVAREEGIRVPSISGLETGTERESWEAEVPLPWVLKADGTCGGGGVKIVHTPEEAREAYRQLPRTFRFTRAIKRLLVNRDPFWLRSWWDRSPHPLSAQSYVNGRPANCAVFAWKGRVLALIGVEVVSSFGLTGPASVVRVVDNSSMISAAEKLASRLGLSGFFGLDFVIENESEIAFLIEMNVRATPPCHLRLGEGRDLTGALCAELSNQPLWEAPKVTENEMIAYYPQPNDSNTEILRACYLDIPVGEPELAKELLRLWPDTLFVRWFVRLSQMMATSTGMECRTYVNSKLATHPALTTMASETRSAEDSAVMGTDVPLR